ncbi:unnamed protein product [Paramecium sonneborni]|uniref:Uncharacterized protein n=1 Tax=Paramecium sonneborni TaxID=65129 RepID=A0A8S1RSM6_9CILI|nr:unnamed protein product [Paramecium sonneborni]
MVTIRFQIFLLLFLQISAEKTLDPCENYLCILELLQIKSKKALAIDPQKCILKLWVNFQLKSNAYLKFHSLGKKFRKNQISMEQQGLIQIQYWVLTQIKIKK